MKIFENVLPEEYLADLNNHILSPYMTWHFNEQSVKYEGRYDELFQFTYTIVMNGGQINTNNMAYMTLLSEIFKSVGVVNPIIERAKFNLLPRQPYTEEDLNNTIHTDTKDNNESNLKSIIYYPHDSDGDTVIYGKDGATMNITPKANTAVMFDSHLKHRATPPTINKSRVVLNIVYYLDK